jgi:hypothetical protein
LVCRRLAHRVRSPALMPGVFDRESPPHRRHRARRLEASSQLRRFSLRDRVRARRSERATSVLHSSGFRDLLVRCIGTLGESPRAAPGSRCLRGMRDADETDTSDALLVSRNCRLAHLSMAAPLDLRRGAGRLPTEVDSADVLPRGWSDGAGPCLRGRYRRTTRLALLDPTARLVGRRLEPDRWESRARADFDSADFRREHDLPLVSASSSASLAKATSPGASFFRACKRRILRVPVLGWFVRRVCPRTSREAEPSGTHASVSRAPLERRPFDRREARSFGDPARIRRLFAQPSNSRHSGERPACRAARSPRTSLETLSEKRSRVVPFAFGGRRPSSRSGGVVRPFRVPSSPRTRVRRASAFAVARARPCRFCHVFHPASTT